MGWFNVEGGLRRVHERFLMSEEGNSAGNSDVVGGQKHAAHMLQACGLGSTQVLRFRVQDSGVGV